MVERQSSFKKGTISPPQSPTATNQAPSSPNGRLSIVMNKTAALSPNDGKGGASGAQLQHSNTDGSINGFKLENNNNNVLLTHEEGEMEGYANYMKAKQELDDTIKDLDVKLNRVLAKQEYEYLKGYNVYVRQKEKELKATINQLSERYNNQGAKEKKLLAL